MDLNLFTSSELNFITDEAVLFFKILNVEKHNRHRICLNHFDQVGRSATNDFPGRPAPLLLSTSTALIVFWMPGRIR